MVLTGALIQTQSGVFAVAQSSDARVRSRAACQSLYDYCLYQLEHDRSWGASGFANVSAVDPARANNSSGTLPLADKIEIKEVPVANGRVFRGYMPDHGTGFEVEVVNALTSPATNSSAGLPTPHEHVRLAISAWEGSAPTSSSRSRQQIDCLLRLAPLFDGSVLSRGDVTMQANQVVFASKDPFRNEIRSEGNIDLPGLTSGSTVFVKHNAEVTRDNSDISAMAPDKTGMLWSGGQISQSGNQLNSAQIAQAAQESSGRMVQEATSRADIYDLRPENIPQPDFAPGHDVLVPPGEFRFTRALAKVTYRTQSTNALGQTVTQLNTRDEPLDVVEYYDPPGSSTPLKVMRAPLPPMATTEELLSTEVAYGSNFEDIPVVTGERFAVDSSFQDSDTITDPDGNVTVVPELGFKKVANGGSSPVIIDLSSRTITVEPKTRVRPAPRVDSSQPPSSFELTVQAGPGGFPGEPTFQLGNGSNDVVIEADGDISIGQGVTDGLATFISKQGSVTLNPKAQDLRWVEKYFPGNPYPVWVLENEIEIEANPDYTGLVIYAEKDVKIANTSDADWGVRGFVYARRNFLFDVNSQNATFYGSVVAGNNPSEPGAFAIGRGNRATFIYDPDYLKLLTRNLPHNWTRIEPLLWTESNG
jgi:hypothetical protein